MDLPSLAKATQATVELVPHVAPSGLQVIVVIVKQRFEIRPRRHMLGRVSGAKAMLIDQPWDPDKPETSSTKLPSDLCIRKPSTDVILVAHAMAADRAKVRQLDVTMKVGPIEKTLRVFGTRVWFKALTGLMLTPPEPFEAVPLRWELAFGGYDVADPRKPLEEPRNPVGRGMAADPDSLVHQPGPSIEDPRSLITSHRSRPPPAGVGPIGRHWAPRRQYAGTYDERWMKERVPLPPADFDERFNQVAPPDQITPSYLRGGEPVLLANVSPDGPMKFILPRLAFGVATRVDGALTDHHPALDTVLLMPSDRTVDLVWRAAVPVPRPARRLEEIRVYEKRVL